LSVVTFTFDERLSFPEAMEPLTAAFASSAECFALLAIGYNLQRLNIFTAADAEVSQIPLIVEKSLAW
jgi:hypothetical protein